MIIVNKKIEFYWTIRVYNRKGKMNVSACKFTENRVIVEMKGVAAVEAVAAPPTHYLAIIDVSGSMMCDGRLQNVKLSLQHMLPHMKATDTFSLVTFNNVARVLCEQRNDSIRDIEMLISSMVADGGTNMGSALMAARDIVSRTPESHSVCVLLLTDGEVNDGITDNDALVSLMTGIRSLRTSVTVYSVGYGIHHNFELMRLMAHIGNGSYSVVENLEQVASVFGDILGGLMTVTAQNCEILLPATAKAFTQLPVISDAAGHKVQIGNLFNGSEQTIMAESVGGAHINYRYFDPTSRTIVEQSVLVQVESGPEVMRKAELYMLRQDTAQMMKRVSRAEEITADELTALIARLTVHESIGWVATSKSELENILTRIRSAPHLPPQAVLRAVSGVAANNYAVLSCGRGVSMMSAPASSDPDDLAMPACSQVAYNFSTPTQVSVSRSVSGAASQSAPPLPVYIPPPSYHIGSSRSVAGGGGPMFPPSILSGGGGAGAPVPLSRAVAGGFIPSLEPIPSFDESMAQLNIGGHMPSALEIPPPPSIEELEDPDYPFGAPRTPTHQVRPSRVSPFMEPPPIARGPFAVSRMPPAQNNGGMSGSVGDSGSPTEMQDEEVAMKLDFTA